MPFLLLLADFVLCSYQFTIWHFAVTAVVAGIYIAINQSYACDGKPVYDIYKCGNVWIPIVAFLLLAVMHAGGYCLWRFWKQKKMNSGELVNEQSDTLIDN